jgi:DNA polymerase V
MSIKDMDNPGFNRPYQAYTGFSAAGGDFRGRRLTLDELIIDNPVTTFFLQAEEESSLGGLIHPGDILVVDRAADIVHGCLVVAVVQGEMVLREVIRRQGRNVLCSSDDQAGRTDQAGGEIWGRVIYVLHPIRP